MSAFERFSILFLLAGVLCFSVSLSAPLTTSSRAVIDSIIHPKLSFSNTVDELGLVSSRDLTPTVAQAAGIQRSRLGYTQTSGSIVGLTIPAVGITRGVANMSGSVTLNGRLASEIEDRTDLLVQNYSQELQDFYRREKKTLQTKASGGYFFFFQAAANYGYSEEEETRRILADAEFRSFADAAKSLLASAGSTQLRGTYNSNFEYRSEGQRVTLTIFGWVYINQVTLDSGEIFNVVKRNADLVMADNNGNIRQQSPGVVEFDNIEDKTLDTTLGE